MCRNPLHIAFVALGFFITTPAAGEQSVATPPYSWSYQKALNNRITMRCRTTDDIIHAQYEVLKPDGSKRMVETWGKTIDEFKGSDKQLAANGDLLSTKPVISMRFDSVEDLKGASLLAGMSRYGCALHKAII